MQRFTRGLSVLLMATAMVVGGCSKSVEGETKRWTTNTARVAQLEAQFPGFKAAFGARKAAAQKIYDAAATLDGDAKIAKLSEANTALMAGFVDDLDDLDDKMKRLREARVEAAARAGDSSVQLGAKVAAEDAQKALDRADAALKSGAADEAAAGAVLKKIETDLDTAQSAVDKVLQIDQAKKDEAAAAKKAEADSKTAADAAAAKQVAPWKCEYCGAENTHDEQACKSCGAPHKKDDKKGDKKPEAK